MSSESELVLIDASKTLSEALRRLCDSGRQILFVLENGMLRAALSDGDVRRYLLSGGTLEAPISLAANYHPVFLMSTEREKASSLITEKHLPAVPIVDEGMKLLDIVFRYDAVDIDLVGIRTLTKDDLALVLKFFDQMAGDTRAMFNRGDINRIRVVEHLSRQSDDHQVHFAAVVKDSDGKEKMVGYVFLWDLDKKIPWLGIAVHEDWKGRHLGRRLLTYLDEWAEPKGYGGLMLTSVPANIRAHSLYSRMGFEYYGVYPDSEFLYIKRYSATK